MDENREILTLRFIAICVFLQANSSTHDSGGGARS